MCDVMIARGQNNHSDMYMEAKIKYCKGFLSCSTDGEEEPSCWTSKDWDVRRINSKLNSFGRLAPEAVLVWLGEPKRFDHYENRDLPILAVRGRSEEKGNWVYPVSNVRIVQNIPSEIKVPCRGKRKLTEAEAVLLNDCAVPVTEITDREKLSQLRQLTTDSKL